MSAENPGSLNEFAQQRGVDPNKAWLDYSEALHAYRVELAESRGITLDALHEVSLGSIAVSYSEVEINQLLEPAN